jgi:hypothetical protein
MFVIFMVCPERGKILCCCNIAHSGLNHAGMSLVIGIDAAHLGIKRL